MEALHASILHIRMEGQNRVCALQLSHLQML